jgi:hypothetical protein
VYRELFYKSVNTVENTKTLLTLSLRRLSFAVNYQTTSVFTTRKATILLKVQHHGHRRHFIYTLRTNGSTCIAGKSWKKEKHMMTYGMQLRYFNVWVAMLLEVNICGLLSFRWCEKARCMVIFECIGLRKS